MKDPESLINTLLGVAIIVLVLGVWYLGGGSPYLQEILVGGVGLAFVVAGLYGLKHRLPVSRWHVALGAVAIGVAAADYMGVHISLVFAGFVLLALYILRLVLIVSVFRKKK